MKKILMLLVSFLVWQSSFSLPIFAGTAGQVESSISGFMDSTGRPVANGTIGFYTSNTYSTFKTVYSDQTKSTAINQLISLNSDGIPVDSLGNQIVLFGDETYYVRIKNSKGIAIKSFGPVAYGSAYGDDSPSEIYVDVAKTYGTNTAAIDAAFAANPTANPTTFLFNKEAFTYINSKVFPAHIRLLFMNGATLTTTSGKTYDFTATQIEVPKLNGTESVRTAIIGNGTIVSDQSNIGQFHEVWQSTEIHVPTQYATINLADAYARTKIGSTFTLVIDSPTTLSVARTITTNIKEVYFKPGAYITATGINLTFGGQKITALPNEYIFRGTGLQIGLVTNSKVYAEWWGAKTGDSLDDGAAINKAIVFGLLTGPGELELLGSWSEGLSNLYYYLTVPISIIGNTTYPRHFRIKGQGMVTLNTLGTKIVIGNGGSAPSAFILNNSINCSFEDFSIETSVAVDASPGYAFSESFPAGFGGANLYRRNTFKNLRISGFTYGIKNSINPDLYDASEYSNLYFYRDFSGMYLNNTQGAKLSNIVMEEIRDFGVYVTTSNSLSIRDSSFSHYTVNDGHLEKRIDLVILGAKNKTVKPKSSGVLIENCTFSESDAIAFIGDRNVKFSNINYHNNKASNLKRKKSLFNFGYTSTMGVQPDECTIENFVNTGESTAPLAGVLDIDVFPDGGTMNIGLAIGNPGITTIPTQNALPGLKVIGWDPSHNIPTTNTAVTSRNVSFVPVTFDYYRWSKQVNGLLTEYPIVPSADILDTAELVEVRSIINQPSETPTASRLTNTEILEIRDVLDQNSSYTNLATYTLATANCMLNLRGLLEATLNRHLADGTITTIYIPTGSYNLTTPIYASGFSGNGTIVIRSTNITSITSSANVPSVQINLPWYSMDSPVFIVKNNTVPIEIHGIDFNGASSAYGAIAVLNSNYLELDNCKFYNDAVGVTEDGLFIYNSKVYIHNSIVRAGYAALRLWQFSEVFSYDNYVMLTPTYWGLVNTSTLRKAGTNPVGTNPDSAVAGGEIY